MGTKPTSVAPESRVLEVKDGKPATSLVGNYATTNGESKLNLKADGTYTMESTSKVRLADGTEKVAAGSISGNWSSTKEHLILKQSKGILSNYLWSFKGDDLTLKPVAESPGVTYRRSN